MGMGYPYSTGGEGGGSDQWMVGENGSPSTPNSPHRTTPHHSHHHSHRDNNNNNSNSNHNSNHNDSNGGSIAGFHSSEKMTSSHVPFSSYQEGMDDALDQGQGLDQEESSPYTPLSCRSEKSLLPSALGSGQGSESRPGLGPGPASSSRLPDVALFKDDSVLHHHIINNSNSNNTTTTTTTNNNNNNISNGNSRSMDVGIEHILHSQCLHISPAAASSSSSASSSSRSVVRTNSGSRVGRSFLIGSSSAGSNSSSSSSGKRSSSSSSSTYQHFYALPDDKFMASLGPLNYDER